MCNACGWEVFPSLQPMTNPSYCDSPDGLLKFPQHDYNVLKEVSASQLK